MSKIELVIVPDLYTSYGKLTTYLEKRDYTDLFINQPIHLQKYISKLIVGASYREIINRIRAQKLIPEPVNSWRYPLEPLLTALPKLRGKLNLHCYVTPNYHRLRIGKASELALLTLRSNVTRDINVSAWKNNIRDWLKEKPRERKREADFIHHQAGEKSICVLNSTGKKLESLLKEKGHTVITKKLEDCYHPNPLQTLENKLTRKDGMPQEEIENLIRKQLEYIRDYVLKNQNLDQAHWKWSWDKFPDVKKRYDTEDVEMLGRIRLIKL